MSQFSGHFDAISKRLWCHQQNVKKASETQGRCVKIVVLSPFMDLLCCVRNKNNVCTLMKNYVLTWVLSWCLFPFLLHNLGNKQEKKIMYVLSWKTMCSLECYRGVYFPFCFTIWEINKKKNNVCTLMKNYVLTWVLSWCLFPFLLHNSGNKQE